MVPKYIAPLFAAGLALAACAGTPYEAGRNVGQGLREVVNIGAAAAYTAGTKDLSPLIQIILPKAINDKSDNIADKVYNQCC